MPVKFWSALYLENGMRKLPRNTFLCSEEGTTAIEYALLGALIAVTIVVSVGLVGTALNVNFYEKIAKAVADAVASMP